MNLKFPVAAIFMTFALSTNADFVTDSRAYELKPASVSIPTSQNSDVRFSECGECDSIVARLTPGTHFRVNGQSVRFEKFREAMQQARNSERGIVLLKNNLKTDTIVSVSVNYK